MARRIQPLLNGYSVGRRAVIDGKIACQTCGQFKEPEGSFTLQHGQWSRNCYPCESDRVAMIHLRERIKKHGAIAEIASIQQAERDIVARKDRLKRVLQERLDARGAGI